MPLNGYRVLSLCGAMGCLLLTYAGVPTAPGLSTGHLREEYLQLREEKGNIFASKYLKENTFIGI